MKKLAILAALALMGISASCWAAAQATVTLNNFDAQGGAGAPIFYLNSGSAATGAGFFAQVLGGPAGGPLAPVVVAGQTTSVFPIDAGFFDAGVGTVPGVAAGGQASFEVRAWKGAATDTWDTAKERGTTGPMAAQATGSWDPAAVPPSPATGPALAMTSFTITAAAIPEPSTLALGLLGAAALLIRRRK